MFFSLAELWNISIPLPSYANKHLWNDRKWHASSNKHSALNNVLSLGTDDRFPYEGGNNDTNPHDWRMRQDLRTPRAYWKSSATKGKNLHIPICPWGRIQIVEGQRHLERVLVLIQSFGDWSTWGFLLRMKGKLMGFGSLRSDRRTKMLLILWGNLALQKSNCFRTSLYKRFIKKRFRKRACF